MISLRVHNYRQNQIVEKKNSKVSRLPLTMVIYAMRYGLAIELQDEKTAVYVCIIKNKIISEVQYKNMINYNKKPIFIERVDMLWSLVEIFRAVHSFNLQLTIYFEPARKLINLYFVAGKQNRKFYCTALHEKLLHLALSQSLQGIFKLFQE